MNMDSEDTRCKHFPIHLQFAGHRMVWQEGIRVKKVTEGLDLARHLM